MPVSTFGSAVLQYFVPLSLCSNAGKNPGDATAWDDDDGEESTWEDELPTRGREKRRDGGGRGGSSAGQPLSAINDTVKNHVPYTAVTQAAAQRIYRGDRQLHSLQRKVEVPPSLMIESQKDASATPTVLAAAMLRSARESQASAMHWSPVTQLPLV